MEWWNRKPEYDLVDNDDDVIDNDYVEMCWLLLEIIKYGHV